MTKRELSNKGKEALASATFDATPSPDQLAVDEPHSDIGLFIVTYILVTPGCLPLAHGSTLTMETDEPLPAIQGMRMTPATHLAPKPTSGFQTVSLKFWQCKDEKDYPPETNYGMVLATRVLSAVIGENLAWPLDREPREANEYSSRTVVEATTFVTKEEDPFSNDRDSGPLARCIEVLLHVHLAHRISSNSLVPALTYERIFPTVFALTRDIDSSRFHANYVEIPLKHSNNKAPEEITLPTDDVFRLSQHYVRTSAKDPFIRVAERKLEAQVELWTNGSTTKSVIETAIAAEILFDSLLRLMMWEDSISDRGLVEDPVEVFQGNLRPRLQKYYAPRLGGDWSLNRGKLGNWTPDIASIRNRVVHGGYTPSHSEARTAIDSLSEIQTFLGERLAYKYKKYRRTCWLYLGEEGLRRTNQVNKVRRDPVNDSTIVKWIREFGEWWDPIELEIQAQTAKEKKPRRKKTQSSKK